MVYDQLYLGGTFNEEHSPVQTPTTVICARGIDGNLADIYAETPEQSRIIAEQIISILSWLYDDELLRRFCEVSGAMQVACSFREGMLAEAPQLQVDQINWQDFSEEDRVLLRKVAFDLLRDFSVWAMAHNRDGEHIGA